MELVALNLYAMTLSQVIWSGSAMIDITCVIHTVYSSVVLLVFIVYFFQEKFQTIHQLLSLRLLVQDIP